MTIRDIFSPLKFYIRFLTDQKQCDPMVYEKGMVSTEAGKLENRYIPLSVGGWCPNSVLARETTSGGKYSINKRLRL
jgi:hypothetical protein